MMRERKSSTISMANIDPGRDRSLLDQTSPYHDHDSFDDAPASRASTSARPMFSFLKRFQYAKVGHQGPDDSNDEHKQEGHEPFPSREQGHLTASAERWFTPLFLLLLMSSLLNVFLIFNGPTAVSQGLRLHKQQNHNPHSWEEKHDGKNVTCYETHEHQFTANYDFSDVYHSHDKLWEELQGPAGGLVYSDRNRADGKERPAGIAMFHQLHCLAGFRHAIQQLQEGKKIGYSVFTDVSEHRGHWPHCFDYLKQSIECYADDSVEVSIIDAGDFTFDGYDSPGRQCRNKEWLYEVTKCGMEGCPGKEFGHTKSEMARIEVEEAEDIEKWKMETGWTG